MIRRVVKLHIIIFMIRMELVRESLLMSKLISDGILRKELR